ncbi:MAG TPA: chromate transporter [Firmicutes bacterium]|nr:chromate transporter [Candidatus Fermentithermobacillaceae bacterium]
MILQLFTVFAKIGAFSFGGGYAVISLISREVVEARNWLAMTEFLDVIAISQGTPGPIAINAATYVGYRMAGFWGSLAATLGVIMFPVIIMLLLGALFSRYKEVRIVKDILAGIRPVVVALIASAAASVVGTTVTGIIPAVVAVAVLVGTTLFKIDPVLLLSLAGIMGWFMYR